MSTEDTGPASEGQRGEFLGGMGWWSMLGRRKMADQFKLDECCDSQTGLGGCGADGQEGHSGDGALRKGCAQAKDG